MRFKNIKGQRFGNLTVLQRSPKKNAKGQVYWICRCDCKRLLVVRGDDLRLGTTVRCSVCRGSAGRPSVFVEGCEEHGTL